MQTTTLNAKKDKGIVPMIVTVKKALNAELTIVSISLHIMAAVTNLKNKSGCLVCQMNELYVLYNVYLIFAQIYDFKHQLA